MSFTDRQTSVVGLDRGLLDHLLGEHQTRQMPRLQKLWDYYRNPARSSVASDQPFGNWAQQDGLQGRLTGEVNGESASGQSRERVIENDIAWRLHTLVDFMFGRPFVVQSLAESDGQAETIETFLNAVFTVNGGIGLFQDMALLGSVYGHIDLLLRLEGLNPATTSNTVADRRGLEAQAARFIIELIDAPRAVPVLHPADYRSLEAYLIHDQRTLNQMESPKGLARFKPHWLDRWLGGGQGAGPSQRRMTAQFTEVWSAAQVARLQDGQVLEQTINPLGRIPVVHIQNLSQPYFYEGLSDVEPLVPLQDELNTRLSDRANRVTFQCFKMYLGKGIEGFTERPVGPGQMWATDNLEASIQEFGGDGKSPSEDAHIAEIRDALDKASGVNAVAAGLLRDRVGNLTSENALRIVLMGLLAKTQRRRITYGNGIERLCELLLHAADVTGVLPNHPDDRRVRIDWPSPIPENNRERLQEAQLKLQIGIPRQQVLTELGYAEIVSEPTDQINV